MLAPIYIAFAYMPSEYRASSFTASCWRDHLHNDGTGIDSLESKTRFRKDYLTRYWTLITKSKIIKRFLVCLLHRDEVAQVAFGETGLVEDFEHFSLARQGPLIPKMPDFLEMLLLEVLTEFKH